MTDEARDKRLAENEAIVREVNERVEEVAGAWHNPEEAIDFLCECSKKQCGARVSLTVAEYERVRSNAAWFFVTNEHADPEIERIVERPDGWLLVEKTGVAEAVADETNPRP